MSGHEVHATELRVGDTVQMVTGDVVVTAAFASHGGVELVVRPDRGEKPRVLWFWPRQAVRVGARSEGTGGPGATIAARPARGAANRSAESACGKGAK